MTSNHDCLGEPAPHPPLRVFFGTISSRMPGGIYPTEKPFQDACSRIGGIEVREIPFGSRSINESLFDRLFGRFLDLIRYARAVSREKPDVVHLNSAFDHRALLRDVGYAWLSRLLGQPLFLKLHGSDAGLLENPSPFWRRLTAWTLENTSAIGVLSSEEKQNFVDAGYPGDRFHVVKNAVNWRGFENLSRTRPTTPTLLFLARFVATKGLLDVIRALALLIGGGRSVLLRCVGDGPQRAQAEELVTTLGIAEHVKFTGMLAERETWQYYLNSTMLVLPSRSEGFSMTIFQSLAAGLPVLTTRIRAAADYLNQPDNALWIEAGKPEQIAETIAHLLDHPEMAETMSQNGKVLAAEFDAEILVPEYLSIYRRISRSRTAGREEDSTGAPARKS